MHGGRISGAVACMHGRWFDLKAGFDLTYSSDCFSFLFDLFILSHIYFISKQWIELKLAMHGGRISGAVACMHGRWFDLKAGFNLTHWLVVVFCSVGTINARPLIRSWIFFDTQTFRLFNVEGVLELCWAAPIEPRQIECSGFFLLNHNGQTRVYRLVSG